MTAARPQWEFRRNKNGTWTWLTGDLGSLSSSHKDFGAVVADALKHGFQPAKDKWLVKDRHFVTRFAPGEPAQMETKPTP